MKSIRERIEDTSKIEIVKGENEKIQATGEKRHDNLNCQQHPW